MQDAGSVRLILLLLTIDPVLLTIYYLDCLRLNNHFYFIDTVFIYSQRYKNEITTSYLLIDLGKFACNFQYKTC